MLEKFCKLTLISLPYFHIQVNVGGKQYTADHILIAVGGRPTIPNIPGKNKFSFCKYRTKMRRGDFSANFVRPPSSESPSKY